MEKKRQNMWEIGQQLSAKELDGVIGGGCVCGCFGVSSTADNDNANDEINTCSRCYCDDYWPTRSANDAILHY